MAREFSKKSLQICRDFLQTAVIIDDRAFPLSTKSTPIKIEAPGRGRQSSTDNKKVSPKQERLLKTSLLIKSFAEQGIICSALEFTSFKENATAFDQTAKSADIAVIDWQMESERTGENALRLMSLLLKADLSNPERFRLITIYTGSEDLEGISQKVVAHIYESHNIVLEVDQNGLLLVCYPIVIAIYAKSPHGLPEKFQTNVADESVLPEKIVECFSNAVSGLLPNTVLSAITAIRQSTHRLVAQFHKDLDYAYLTHRASLPRPDDAAVHLETLIAEEIKSTLTSYDCIGSNASFPVIKKWVEERYPRAHGFVHPDGSQLSREDILKCLQKGSEGADSPPLNKKKRQQLYKHFSNILVKDMEASLNGDLALSKLSVLKTRYMNTPPYLTMGIILQQTRDKSLWVCIQPRCDSVRLKNAFNKFPLLPIFSGKPDSLKHKSVLPKFHDDFADNFAYISIHPQNCQSIEFKSARKDNSQIFPKRERAKWVFLTTIKGIRYEFVAELKDEIIQSILNDFAATTARVGTNPSEWLRRSGEDSSG